jgi:ElaA protein
MNLRFTHKAFADLELRELYDLLALRDRVFVVGQKITAESEIDGQDPECVHVMGRDDDGAIVATARLFLDQQPAIVGRVAVDTHLQRLGLGRQLMAHVHHVLGDRPGAMSAQAHLADWYASMGWQPEGEVFIEAELPHLHMNRPGLGGA